MFNLGEVTAVVKKHPYETTIMVLMGATALYLVLHSGGSSASTASVTGSGQPSESFQLQAMSLGNQLQTANLQAQSAANVIHGQVEIAGIQSGTQTYLGKLALDAQVAIQSLLSGVQAKTIDDQTQVQLANINATANTQNQAIAAGITNSQIQSQQATTLAQINSQTQQSIVNALTKPKTTTTTVPLTQTQSEEQYLANNPDVVTNYNLYHSMWGDPNSSQYDPDLAKFTEDQFAAYHFQTFGSSEGRKWPTTGTQTVTG